ncbi:MAG: hypothetical protein GY866_15545 [Proteobacteria bacterium]|nr:hypothetical protein [Pseudomonadota bacterium]
MGSAGRKNQSGHRNPGGTVKEAVDSFNEGRLTFTEEANVEKGHRD